MANHFGAFPWVYAFLGIVAATGAASDILLNYWVKSGSAIWFVGALALSASSVVCFSWALKEREFAFGAAVVLALLLHSVVAVLFDRLYFGGHLTHWQWAGIACALAAIVLINPNAAAAR